MTALLKQDLPDIDSQPVVRSARDWVKVLAVYREPDDRRAWSELAITLGPFLAVWALAWWALSFSPLLAFVLGVFNAGFLVRLFVIQHDCGHGSYLSSRSTSDWVGRILGVLTLTPYKVWRRTHSIHHSAAGNLDTRGIGDIYTMTVDEYQSETGLGRARYVFYRHPLFLFGFVPAYLFLLQNRLPVGLMRSGWTYWISAMGTNLAIAALLGTIWYFGGWAPILLIFLPSTIVAAIVGVWLFYVQHQFEDTSWDHAEEWQMHDAALHGSSFYDLPTVLRWFSANIGVHHVHHLYSRIPFYRLNEVLKDHDVLAHSQRLTLRDSFACANLQLWDEKQRRLISFAKARTLYGVA